MTIRSLFDPSKDIYRTIEKVITYGASQEGRLKAEISEYVVTESIEEQFRKLLDRMQLAMESGGENEVGVWVSGFYGSGKSSFTKYLGLAFDDQRTIDGTPFINYLQAHRRDIEALPDTGVPGELRRELAEDLGTLSERLSKEDFYKHTADFNSQLTHLKGRVRDAVITLSDQQKLRLKEGVEDLQRIPEWEELTQEERGNAVNRLDGLALAATQDLAGLKKLLARDYDINSTLEDLKRSIQRQGQERLRKRMEEERAKTGEKGPVKLTKSIAVPVKMTSAADIDALIQQLHEIKAQLALYAEIEVSFALKGE